MYALYKQATVGVAPDEAPSAFDIKGYKKWEAWAACRSLSTSEAEARYVQLVDGLCAGGAPVRASDASVRESFQLANVSNPPLMASWCKTVSKCMFGTSGDDDTFTSKPVLAARKQTDSVGAWFCCS